MQLNASHSVPAASKELKQVAGGEGTSEGGGWGERGEPQEEGRGAGRVRGG